MVEDQDTTQDEVSQERLAEVTGWSELLTEANELVQDDNIEDAIPLLDELGGEMLSAGAINLALSLVLTVTALEGDEVEKGADALDSFATAVEEVVEEHS